MRSARCLGVRRAMTPLGAARVVYRAPVIGMTGSLWPRHDPDARQRLPESAERTVPKFRPLLLRVGALTAHSRSHGDG